MPHSSPVRIRDPTTFAAPADPTRHNPGHGITTASERSDRRFAPDERPGSSSAPMTMRTRRPTSSRSSSRASSTESIPSRTSPRSPASFRSGRATVTSSSRPSTGRPHALASTPTSSPRSSGRSPSRRAPRRNSSALRADCAFAFTRESLRPYLSSVENGVHTGRTSSDVGAALDDRDELSRRALSPRAGWPLDSSMRRTYLT